MATKKNPPRRPGAARGDTVAEPPEMTVNEAAAVYPDQWVLMRVTGRNEYQMPWRGHILAVSPEEQEITEALRREPRLSSIAAGAPRPLYYVFQAYPHVFEPEALRGLFTKRCEPRRADGQAAEG